MRKSAKREKRTLLLMKKGSLIFLMGRESLKVISCRHPSGQIHPQNILFPTSVKSIIAAAITIIGGGKKALIL
jgi:hypothetical protein